MGTNVDGQLGIADKALIQKNTPVLVEALL
jgi:hypothetical protein